MSSGMIGAEWAFRGSAEIPAPILDETDNNASAAGRRNQGAFAAPPTSSGTDSFFPQGYSSTSSRTRKRKRATDGNEKIESLEAFSTSTKMTNDERVKILNKKFFEDFQNFNVRPCDMDDFRNGNLKECVEYADIIIDEKKKIETLHNPNPKYFTEVQGDIKPRMRTILFNWLVEVHKKFKLTEVSLWTGFSIADRFLSKIELNRDRLQLIGCCSLWIATKYHEIYPPLSKDFVYIADDAFSRKDLLRCEEVICEHLGFNFTVPTVYTFLCRYIKIATNNIELRRRRDRVKWLSHYSAERVILKPESLAFTPSQIAAGAVHSALSMTGRDWSREIEEFTGYQVADIKKVCRLTRRVVLKFDDKKHSAVIAKYEVPERGSVSMLRKKQNAEATSAGVKGRGAR